ncbi:hypothetical protein [Nocardia sp. XZ_19_385]|uniref:hypothetical protein n=1 Tax=Nocardia sp. XZ_19_385 TaxID=2769488 RepID=UPI00188DC984|nr:hypothetical protein [Nocardia sp. XZ_19_385]
MAHLVLRRAISCSAACTALAMTLGALSCSRDSGPASVDTPVIDLRVPPSELRWTPFNGMQLPVAHQGPATDNGAVVAGFDRSPVGAALAAIHATVRMSVALDSQWPAVTAAMLAPGPGRDQWAVLRTQISITEAMTGEAPSIAGYRVDRYTPEAADVSIYSRQADASLTRNTTTVLWHSGDWQLLVPYQRAVSAVTAVEALPAEAVALSPA